jgi:AcrR family transcriptional regulator
MPFVAEEKGDGTLGLRERKKQRTRSTLIDAAVTLCEQQGFERTTVDQIAAVADVSPRTFSRYFPTKDAIALALIDEAIDKSAVVLADLPSDVGPLEALKQSYLGMYESTRSAQPGELTSERMLSTIRIIMTSPALRQAALEYRPHTVNVLLAARMGVEPGDRRVKLVSAVWASLVMTAMGDLDENTDWNRLSIDDVIFRLESTYAEYTALQANVGQPV